MSVSACLCCRRYAAAHSSRCRKPARRVQVVSARVQAAPSRKLSLAVVGVSGNFLWDDDKEVDRKARLSGSGAARAAWAMFAFLEQRECVTFIALTGRDAASRVPSGLVRERRWKGIRVLQGSSQAIHDALRSRLMAFDFAIAADLHSDVVSFALDLPARHVFAATHSFQELPFGPLSVLLHGDEAKHVRPNLLTQAQLLTRVTLLSPSESVTAYIDQFGGGTNGAATCYAACYGYFMPRPPRHNLFDGRHEHVTCVSPCPHKGLSVLLGVARALPHVQFAAVATSWTQQEDRLMLKLEPNVRIVEASMDVDRIYARTRILLAPSVWCEAFGLVVVEAGLRGIPCVSSDSGGLPEANPVPHLVVKTSLVYDVPRCKLLRGANQRTALDGRPGGSVLPSSPKQSAVTQAMEHMAAVTGGSEKRFLAATEVASAEEVAGYVGRLQNLLQSASDLRTAADAAFSGSTEFVERHEAHNLSGILRAQLGLRT